MDCTKLRIGSRASPLAQRQAGIVQEVLATAGVHLRCSILPIRTRGDSIQDRSLVELGGQGVFTRELDDAVLDGRIDLAVHSMKDMPTAVHSGITVAAVLSREDPRDVLVTVEGSAGSLRDLPVGAVIGTSSPRRAAQVLRFRSDVEVCPLRGNVGTRLQKIQEGRASATLLAAAGLVRLGEIELASEPLAVEEMLPAPAQGAIAVTCREKDEEMQALLTRIDNAAARSETGAERSLLAALEGGCRSPIAALARVKNGNLSLAARLLELDGSGVLEVHKSGGLADAAEMGRDAAEELLGARKTNAGGES